MRLKDKFRTSIYSVLLAATILSCKKYVDPGAPGTELTSGTIFNNDATAQSALLSVYAQLEADGFPYNMIVYTGLSADELTNYSSNVNAVQLYTNNLTAENTYMEAVWSSLYKYIYQVNAVIEGVSKSHGLSQSVSRQLTGESLFLRAFFHFYLSSLFGEVPVVISTDYRVNAISPRSSVSKVYQQLIADLTKAKELLTDEYRGLNATTTERVRPNKAAALALLARVCLYTGDYTGALESASEVINQPAMYSLENNLNNVFLKSSSEAIWQLQAVVPGFNSYPGGMLILTTTPSVVALSNHLMNSFETGDQRMNSWTASVAVGSSIYYYPFKYKVGQNAFGISEYTMVLRLAELYLIRAEAKAMQDDLNGATQDINAIRLRAGLSSISFGNKQELLFAINKQRRSELFAEFGDRWLDIKRKDIATAVLQPIKGTDWTSGTDELYPIPRTEIIRNPALTQNSGY